MKNRIIHGFQLISVLVLIFLFIGQQAAAEDNPKKILILPPSINASEDLSYLRKGIADMLSSRISEIENARAIDFNRAFEGQDSPSTLARAADLAKKAGADYVIVHSVTVIGSNVSTDAKVIDARSGGIVLSFGQMGKQQADIISHVDLFAARIGKKLFGVQTASGSQANTKGSPNAETTTGQTSVYQHPEKLLQGPAEIEKPADRQLQPGGEAGSGRLMMRSRRINTQIKGIAGGDVDGDGVNDIVAIDAKKIYIYGVDKGRLFKKAQFKSGSNNAGVDIADLNGNGREEIFITNVHQDSARLSSYVVEFDGSKYNRTAKNLRGFFRHMNLPKRGKIMVVQRQGSDQFFSTSGMYELGYENGSYEGVNRLPVSKKLKVYGTGYGAVQDAKREDVVTYSDSDYVQVLNSRGIEQWSSSERYGGSANITFIKSKIDPKDTDTFYFPLRLTLLDVDGDGVQEILVIKNETSLGRTFKNIRFFKHGRLEILKWDQLGLSPVWRTRNIAKHISDFAVIDVNGDKRPEIAASVVLKNSSGMASGNSFIAVFEIGDLEKAAK